MGDRKKQLVRNLGKLVGHALYPGHNELQPSEILGYPTHYEIENKTEEKA